MSESILFCSRCRSVVLESPTVLRVEPAGPAEPSALVSCPDRSWRLEDFMRGPLLVPLIAGCHGRR